jgi:hypothetical protein
MNFLGNLQYVAIAGVGGALVLSGSSISIGSIQAMLQYSKKRTPGHTVGGACTGDYAPSSRALRLSGKHSSLLLIHH